MKKFISLVFFGSFLCLSATIVQRLIVNYNGNDIWQIDAQISEDILGHVGMASLYGNAVHEYTRANKNEILIISTDQTTGHLFFAVTRENNNGKREAKWVGMIDGSHGPGTSKFESPGGVCILPSADFANDHTLYVYVADEGNNRVVRLKFNTEKHDLTWNCQLTSYLSKPIDVSCSWVGANPGVSVLAIASSGNDRIVFYKIGSNGSTSYLTSYDASFSHPNSVVLRRKFDDNFYLFVGDCNNNRVRRTDLSLSGSTLSFYYTNVFQLNTLKGFYVSAIAGNEQVLFVHDIARNKIVAYDFSLAEKLYETSAHKPHYMSFHGGETALSEDWTYSSGLKYYWLDSEFKEAGAIPNVFRVGQQDVAVNYVITGGGKVTIKVYTPSNPTTPVRT
ncbi:hypothetical protein GX441_04860, partial [bacterium]|nr:hypothetical protein [bacterium]